jgi:AcrR family transcriptional regulator
MTVTRRIDARLARGEASRNAILEQAVRIASVEGLDALSIGRLANNLDVSKSNVFSLFGSKEELQLAAIRYASSIFAHHVVEPVFQVAPGIDRVTCMYEAWLEYSRKRVFPGGCFFCTITAEYASREGRVHDALADIRREWVELQERVISDAIQLGQLSSGSDPTQLAFELDAIAKAANSDATLWDDDTVYQTAAIAIRNRISAVACASRRGRLRRN